MTHDMSDVYARVGARAHCGCQAVAILHKGKYTVNKGKVKTFQKHVLKIRLFQPPWPMSDFVARAHIISIPGRAAAVKRDAECDPAKPKVCRTMAADAPSAATEQRPCTSRSAFSMLMDAVRVSISMRRGRTCRLPPAAAITIDIAVHD